jgi:RNA polymerase sigma factor, sigma-70 family
LSLWPGAAPEEERPGLRAEADHHHTVQGHCRPDRPVRPAGPAAFRLLYERTSAKLFGVTLRILKDRSEAEEAIQEVYVKIWQRADRYVAGNTSPISWLVAVARNHALDILRARRPVAEDIDVALELPDGGPSPERAAEDSQARSRIEHCLGTLDPDRAEAVRGAYLDGYSYEELASRFAVPLNTMRTWLRRSLIKLKECLTT